MFCVRKPSSCNPPFRSQCRCSWYLLYSLKGDFIDAVLQLILKDDVAYARVIAVSMDLYALIDLKAFLWDRH